MVTRTDLDAIRHPKRQEDAAREFLRAMGDPRTLNKYLSVGIVLLAMVILALIGLNAEAATRQRERIVVRVDEIGRAQLIGQTSTSQTLRDPEVKYFLAQFVHDFYGMNRSTIREDFSRALLFINSETANALMEQERKDKRIEKFIFNGDDEIDIHVDNIILTNITRSPYSAQVVLTKIYRDHAGTAEQERVVDTFTFTISDEVPNAVLLVNPLGFNIMSMREDKAF